MPSLKKVVARSTALRKAQRVLRALRDAGLDAELAGSLRRGKMAVGDIDIVAIGLGDAVRSALGPVAKFVQGANRLQTWVLSGSQVNVMIGSEDERGAMLMYATGSGRWNQHVRSIAKLRGLLLNQYGLWRGAERIAGRTEQEVFDALRLPFVPPVLREMDGVQATVAHVRSASRIDVEYAVSAQRHEGIERWSCTCPHHRYRGVDCKHMEAVRSAMRGEMRHQVLLTEDSHGWLAPAGRST